MALHESGGERHQSREGADGRVGLVGVAQAAERRPVAVEVEARLEQLAVVDRLLGDHAVRVTGVGGRESPVPETLLHGGLWVADAVYYPLWTPLLLAAKARGARVMTGRELAIHQAADAFQLFTGLKPSTVEMARAFDSVMGEAR